MNKTVLITGATSGIGKVTALELAKKGMNIVFTARNKVKAQNVKDEIITKSNNPNVDFFECDLDSFTSIVKFVADFKKKYTRLDILINNAGTWETSRKETVDGVEQIFAVNHLAPFLLTNLLLDLIQKSSPARIINVSSRMHFGDIDFKDLEGKDHFNANKAYAQSKLANILFTKKLAKILEGKNVTVNCLHPGVVRTDLFKNLPKIVQFVFGLFQISPEKGAETTIYLASSDEVTNITGKYFVKSKVAESGEYSNKTDIADKLWDASLEYVKDFL